MAVPLPPVPVETGPGSGRRPRPPAQQQPRGAGLALERYASQSRHRPPHLEDGLERKSIVGSAKERRQPKVKSPTGRRTERNWRPVAPTEPSSAGSSRASRLSRAPAAAAPSAASAGTRTGRCTSSSPAAWTGFVPTRSLGRRLECFAIQRLCWISSSLTRTWITPETR